MSGRLRSLKERPISDRERPRAFALAIAVVLATAVGLLVLGPPETPEDQPPPPSTAPTASGDLPDVPTGGEEPKAGHQAGTGALRAGRRFLNGYLDYLYGRGSARRVRGATAQLTRRLRRDPPRVSPATRRRSPRIAEISTKALGGGRAHVVAEIDDGEVARYPIELVLTGRGGRWLVTKVEGD